MTKEQIETTEAGHRMDELMAEKVMEWKITGDGIWKPGGVLVVPCAGVPWVPNYSTSIADAFEVVERMREKGWFLHLIAPDYGDLRQWRAHLGGPHGIASSAADTAPLAICRAALLAVAQE